MGSRCVFLGELKGEAKFIALLGADAFALPSHSEGLPVAAIEAMAAGLPIIISPGCNLPEVGSRGAGLIIQPNPEAVAGAIDCLFADDDRRKLMGTNGRALVEERLTWPKIAAQLLDLYAALASPRFAPASR
jgi:poly(glycerol-phosphate) alpha-glucosyltransferase